MEQPLTLEEGKLGEQGEQEQPLVLGQAGEQGEQEGQA